MALDTCYAEILPMLVVMIKQPEKRSLSASPSHRVSVSVQKECQ